jgi:hypothetical protein
MCVQSQNACFFGTNVATQLCEQWTVDCGEDALSLLQKGADSDDKPYVFESRSSSKRGPAQLALAGPLQWLTVL